MRYFALLLMASALLGEEPDARLSGRWRSLETSQGGIGAVFQFHPDGSVDFSPGAVVETKYRIEGDQLILPPATVNGPELKQAIVWISRNHLRLGERGESIELTRADQAEHKDHDLTGEWVGTREMAGSTHETRYVFSSDGKALFLLPFVTQSGRYSTKGGTIRIELPNRQPVEGKYRIDGDTITIPGPRGQGDSKFARY